MLKPTCILLLSLLISSLLFSAHAAKLAESPPHRLVTYPLPAGLQVSTVYKVMVNHTPLTVERVGEGGRESLHAINFSCQGAQVVTIKVPEKISTYAIRPISRKIAGRVNGRTLTFTLSGPQKLYIEVNHLPDLAVFANPLELNPPHQGDAGVLYYGPGIHNEGTIWLQSHQTLYIAGGAVLNADLRGKHISNVKVLGRGLLNGNVRIANSASISVEGIFVRNTESWSNTFIDCRNTIYRNVKVFSYKTVWGIDGIDPVSCKNFTITDCFIRTRDDCISIKSMEHFGRDSVENINTDSIMVTNCVLVGWSHADGVTMGFELQGGVAQNVTVKNCDILASGGQGRTGGHAGFSIVCDGPSLVQKVRFEDIRVEDRMEYKNLELIVTEGRRYGTAGPGHIKGVYLKNIRWQNPGKPFVIAGVPENWVEDVVFDHCFIGGKPLTSFRDGDFQVEFARNIQFK